MRDEPCASDGARVWMGHRRDKGAAHPEAAVAGVGAVQRDPDGAGSERANGPVVPILAE